MGLIGDALNRFVRRVDPAPAIVVEAKPAKKELAPPPPAAVRRVGYEYGIALGGSSPSTQSAFSQERLQILTQLYQAYLTCPWVSGPIDLISRTATAGGLQIVVDDISDHGGVIPDDPPEIMRLRRLIKFTNPREDMIQLLRSVATDLLLFGDAYIEVVYLLGEPVALYTLDATTMTVMADEHGEASGYRQEMDGVRTATFDANQVIHVSLDAPRGGIYGVSPAQKAILPVTAWLFTEATLKECFRRGDPPRLHVDLGSMKELDVQRWREQFTVSNLGPKAVGNPIVTTGGGIVTNLDARKVQDYLDTATQLRDTIISCFGTPPSKLGIIETGNIGAGTGEAQDKTFRVNTIYPVQALILEKLNFQLLQQGFGVYGWHLEFGEIDMRDSKVVEEIRDMRLRNGSYTLNRYRDEIGEPPVDGGDDAILVDRQNIVIWSDIDALSKAGVAYKTKGTTLDVTAPTPGEPIQVVKPDVAVQPTQPPHPPSLTDPADQMPPGPGSGSDKRLPPADRPGGPNDAIQGKAPRESRFDGDARRLSQAWSHSYAARRKQALKELPPVPATPKATEAAQVLDGAMVALVPSDADLQRLAVDGGEPVGQLHLTLMYLGKVDDLGKDAYSAVVDAMQPVAQQTAAVAADGFAISVFNPASDERDTCIVLGVTGQPLDAVHDLVVQAISGGAVGSVPQQHAPWVPHVTLTYSDDLSVVKQLVDRTGPIVFDKLRVAFGSNTTDLPLTGPAGGEAPQPADKYWDGDHNHGATPDYTADDLGVEQLNLVEADPRDVRTDHRYQRQLIPARVDKLAKKAGQLVDWIGLLAIRPDGSMWVLSGQHHTAAAVQDGLSKMAYRAFDSTGWEMERQVYRAYHQWHERMHNEMGDKPHPREH